MRIPLLLLSFSLLCLARKKKTKTYLVKTRDKEINKYKNDWSGNETSFYNGLESESNCYNPCTNYNDCLNAGACFSCRKYDIVNNRFCDSHENCPRMCVQPPPRNQYCGQYCDTWQDCLNAGDCSSCRIFSQGVHCRSPAENCPRVCVIPPPSGQPEPAPAPAPTPVINPPPASGCYSRCNTHADCLKTRGHGCNKCRQLRSALNHHGPELRCQTPPTVCTGNGRKPCNTNQDCQHPGWPTMTDYVESCQHCRLFNQRLCEQAPVNGCFKTCQSLPSGK